MIAIGELHAGTKYNIVAGKGVLKGTLRCFDAETRELALQEMEKVAQETAKIYAATAVFHLAASPALINDKPGMDGKENIRAIVGSENIVTVVSSLGGEDFADYLEHIPEHSCMLELEIQWTKVHGIHIIMKNLILMNGKYCNTNSCQLCNLLLEE